MTTTFVEGASLAPHLIVQHRIGRGRIGREEDDCDRTVRDLGLACVLVMLVVKSWTRATGSIGLYGVSEVVFKKIRAIVVWEKDGRRQGGSTQRGVACVNHLLKPHLFSYVS